jgi:2-C-methyl-D-erythritol 4-phosphate cytidylyltransferase/2-C-methyl-D-erythritol 2,4-cyclodiphosphate synthase
VNVSIIIVAAGGGERLGYGRPKAFVDLNGLTLLERALAPLNELDGPIDVIVVAPEKWMGAGEDLAQRILDPQHRVTVVAGGATRTDSVRAGLDRVADSVEVVLIHDAARALTPHAVFARVIDHVRAGHPGVIPALDVIDTIAQRHPETGATQAALDRSHLAIVQTPQGFSRQILDEAYRVFSGDATDDAEVVRQSGHTVGSVPGDHMAFKITHPADLHRAHTLLTSPEEQLIGVAADVHRFDGTQPLWLGGVLWPGEAGLSGHSDGDVVIHVICDALLQAASLGDMGALFGSDRPEFEGASSRVFLDHTLNLLSDGGFSIKSVSCQLIANSPRFAPRREEISRELSQIVGAPVHVAATTSDGLGLTGRGEGAAAIAVALVARHSLKDAANK